MTSSEFRLYPEEARWWSFSDYRHVLTITRRLRPYSVLEFGPGSSTLALIEGGAQHIDSCEDNDDWFAVYKERLADAFPVVELVPYTWADPLTIPAIDHHRYDMALIDGPFGTLNRPVVIEYCLARCKAVLVCLETYHSKGLRAAAIMAAERHCKNIQITETGPLSGSFALLI
jgi:hypothetical protein